MKDLILHHYPVSPFAEKVRAIFGFKQLSWHSVNIPMIMPKPDVVALTGGNRRTPILQIGADIICDTNLICDELERLQPQPSLYPAGQQGLARIVSQWADDLVFGPAMAYNFQPKGAAEVFAGADPEFVKAFGEDRKAMRAGAARMLPSDAHPTYLAYLKRLEDQLQGHDYLLGQQATLADFGAYHPLWFTLNRTPSLAGVVDALPAVKAWAERIKAMGHGQPTDMSSVQALKIAQQAQPAPVDDWPWVDYHGLSRGSRVAVKAVSFGQEVTEGDLVACTDSRLVIRHQNERVGEVHVHFPRVGFMLSGAQQP